ncbi:hypothetical protein [Siccibacter turicensis]|uniref:hypothetical protein n=1 Tax=Siccibacter turicensis TaxID=357233 RepID=UPI003F565DE0
MEEFKGTPGPWKLLREEVDKSYIRIRGTKPGERFAVANVLTPVYDDAGERELKETRANAQLIAAAPELLESLQNVLSAWVDEDMADITDAEDNSLIKARAAIAKALGK